MKYRVYVAGASSELERCERVIASVTASENTEVTFDWTKLIREHGGDQVDSRSREQRALGAWVDIDAVIDADLIWILLPRSKTIGAWVELGGALTFNRMLPRIAVPRRRKIVIASWVDSLAAFDEALPFFVTAVDRIFDADAGALAYVVGGAVSPCE